MDLAPFKNYIKNIPGWRSNRKIVSFAVDDYGNVRLASTRARNALEKDGVRLRGRYDSFDALDTRQDYEMLFDVLQSVKDSRGRPAVFTTYALSCNTDYDAIMEQGEYVPEMLDRTYERLSAEDPIAYEGTFLTLKQGIEQGLIRPQFHGREHININLYNDLLRIKNPVLLSNIQHRCLTDMPGLDQYPNVKISEAFAFRNVTETIQHQEIIADGLQRFEKVYGYSAQTFTPPAMQLHPELGDYVSTLGILAIDKPRKHHVHLGDGVYQLEKNVTGLDKHHSHVTLVRNCMFEPNSSDIDWVSATFNQVKAAFFWKKPAIISSHRVNFCGHIDASNREKGLAQLRQLIKKIVDTWPDVEFMSVDDLSTEILKP